MEDLASPLLLSVFWTSISCILLRLFSRTPYNFLCAIWMTLSFSGVILFRIMLSWTDWPTNFFMCAIIVPSGFILYHFNLERFVDKCQVEPRWGRYVFGILLVVSATIFSLAKVFFIELLRLYKQPLNFNEIFNLYLLLVLVIGVAGILVILRARSDFNSWRPR